jgi:hypothetical protein
MQGAGRITVDAREKELTVTMMYYFVYQLQAFTDKRDCCGAFAFPLEPGEIPEVAK